MAFSILRLTRRSIGALGIALIVIAPLAAFALTPADIAPLAGDDFDAKSAAIDKLIASHDAPSQALLKALSEDNALTTDSGEVLIQDGDATRDAITGKTVAANGAQPVTLNNLLRSKVSGALSGSQLDSPDLQTRRAAINALLQNPDPSMKPLIDAQRAKETDPDLKKKLDTLWAMTALHNSDPATRLEAVQLVAARHDLDMNELLRPLVAKNPDGTFAETDDRVRAAAQAGIEEIGRASCRERVFALV